MSDMESDTVYSKFCSGSVLPRQPAMQVCSCLDCFPRMTFIKQNNRYIGYVQCSGGRDGFVEVLPSDSPVKNIKMYPLSECSPAERTTDPKRILEMAVKANSKISELETKPYYVKEIGYMPNDSRAYDIHYGLILEILSMLSNGFAFEEIPPK